MPQVQKYGAHKNAPMRSRIKGRKVALECLPMNGNLEFRYLRKVFLVVFMSEVNLEIHKPPLRPPASTERVVEEQVEG